MSSRIFSDLSAAGAAAQTREKTTAMQIRRTFNPYPFTLRGHERSRFETVIALR
jgi:hypothetical protein